MNYQQHSDKNEFHFYFHLDINFKERQILSTQNTLSKPDNDRITNTANDRQGQLTDNNLSSNDLTTTTERVPNGRGRRRSNNPNNQRKDLNAPKKVKSAYSFYSAELREKQEYKDLSSREMNALVGKKWGGLPVKEKEKYEKMYHNDADRYAREKKEYDEKGYFVGEKQNHKNEEDESSDEEVDKTESEKKENSAKANSQGDKSPHSKHSEKSNKSNKSNKALASEKERVEKIAATGQNSRMDTSLDATEN